jgi:addiction module HigA family antidote
MVANKHRSQQIATSAHFRGNEPMARVRTHPGEVLREEYLIPLGLSARAIAKDLGVPANRITEIMRGERDVNADTAIRLGRYFRTDPRFWLNLQAAHDLSKAQAKNYCSKIGPTTAA